jgi:hypothetical protein
MFSQGLQKFLVNDPGVQAQIGTRSDGTSGIFPGKVLGRVIMPYVVFYQIDAEPISSFEGTNRLQFARWRFSCAGSTWENSKLVSRAIKLALQGLKTVFTNASNVNIADVHNATLVFDGDDEEAITHGTIFTTHVDFEFIFADLES